MKIHPLTLSEYSDCYCLFHNLFYPLVNFCFENEFDSIVQHEKYQYFPFTVPINLRSEVELFGEVHLHYEGEKVAILMAESFAPDLSEISQKIFGCTDSLHPGVQNFLSSPTFFVGGILEFNEKHRWKYPEPPSLSEWQESKGIKTIAGFHTRNPPHRGHEFLHQEALKEADGILISPILGVKKAGDFTDQAIRAGYQTYFKTNPIQNQDFLFSPIPLTARYLGPREAVLQTIVRKNLGCTHMVIGRDHAGVGNFYHKYASAEKVKGLEKELGIEVIAIKEPYFCPHCGKVTNDTYCRHFDAEKIFLSGTEFRELIQQRKSIDERFFRNNIVNSILEVQKIFT